MALPFTDYFNTGNASNYHTYGIGSDGRVDVFIRNSTGGPPYSNMNSSSEISYRIFIIESSGIIIMEEEGINLQDFEEVRAFLEEN
jgi:hypothetical protein